MPRQLNLYPLHTRRAVVYQYFVLLWTASAISFAHGGHPCPSTVHNIINDFLADGDDGLVRLGKLGSQHATRKLDPIAADFLVDIVEENEGFSLDDIATELQARTGSANAWTRTDVCRALVEIGMSRVRVTSRAYEADEQQREEFRNFCTSRAFSSDQLVFMDEVASDARNTNIKYAWVPCGDRSKTKCLFVRGIRVNTIAAINVKGVLVHGSYFHPVDKETFQAWFEGAVVPLLQPYPLPNSVVIMDNASIHDKQLLQQAVHAVGAKVFFLPPYSPDYNPIEKLFGWLKRWLRGNREFVFKVSALAAIHTAFDHLHAFAPDACKNWIEYLPFYNNV